MEVLAALVPAFLDPGATEAARGGAPCKLSSSV